MDKKAVCFRKKTQLAFKQITEITEVRTKKLSASVKRHSRRSSKNGNYGSKDKKDSNRNYGSMDKTAPYFRKFYLFQKSRIMRGSIGRMRKAYDNRYTRTL